MVPQRSLRHYLVPQKNLNTLSKVHRKSILENAKTIEEETKIETVINIVEGK